MSAVPTELIDCPTCHTQLGLPPGASVVRCGVCGSPISVMRPPPAAAAAAAAAPPSYASLKPSAPPPYGDIVPSRVAPPPPPRSAAQFPVPPLPQPQAFRPPPPVDVPLSANPLSGRGRRRALLVGINYTGTRYELGGCVNDVRCMHYLLTTKLGFRPEDIVMLTDDSPLPHIRPTRQNIVNAMRWLSGQARVDDSLFFHYSGHGGQERDYSGEEADGFNETILPLDHKTAGVIVDNEINALLVNPLPLGVRLHAVIDACHSGTVLDLPYLYKGSDHLFRAQWEQQGPAGGIYKGTKGGEAICFSACADSQISADTKALSRVTSTGAMTYTFIEAIESGRAGTYIQLLDHMKLRLRQASVSSATDTPFPFPGAGGDPIAGVLGMLLSGGGGMRSAARGFTQVPQLSCSTPFDVNRPFFL